MNAATKTAKFTIIRKTIDKAYVIYSKGCREALSKVTRIAKITIIRQTTYEINEIYSKGYREGPSNVTKITKFAKTTKFTKIRHTTLQKSTKFIQRVTGKAHQKVRKSQNLLKVQNLR